MVYDIAAGCIHEQNLLIALSENKYSRYDEEKYSREASRIINETLAQDPNIEYPDAWVCQRKDCHKPGEQRESDDIEWTIPKDTTVVYWGWE